MNESIVLNMLTTFYELYTKCKLFFKILTSPISFLKYLIMIKKLISHKITYSQNILNSFTSFNFPIRNCFCVRKHKDFHHKVTLITSSLIDYPQDHAMKKYF